MPIEQWLVERQARTEAAKLKLLTALLPITWNRMLHGYIFDKARLSDEGIDFSMIELCLNRIIEFYKAFRCFDAPILFDEYRKQHERERNT